MAQKYVYFFGNGHADGRAEMTDLLGGKGANLAEMTNIGLPVPPGFTISTEICKNFYKNNKYPTTLKEEVSTNIKRIEELTDKKFGDPKNPLLLSVRSGAKLSMPGMMDTILNLGLNDITVQGLIAQSNDERFAYDTYRRFVQIYSEVVMGMKRDILEYVVDQQKQERRVTLDIDLNASDWKKVVTIFKASIKKETGNEFPGDPTLQLYGAIDAILGSWMNQRAIAYRKRNNISVEGGTAVNIQAMVFGNMGNDCATGVVFTRDPLTGENYLFGEFLLNAQGEDIVSGIRTPQPINRVKNKNGTFPSLEEVMPECYQQIVKICKILEKHFNDMQDIEFTIQKGILYILQTRSGKRTASSAIRIADDMS